MGKLFSTVMLLWCGGAFLSSAYAGTVWPVIIAVISLAVILKVFTAMD